MSATSNPTLVKITQTQPSIQPPSAEVVERQDPAHTEREFVGDLEKASQRKPGSAS